MTPPTLHLDSQFHKATPYNPSLRYELNSLSPTHYISWEFDFTPGPTPEGITRNDRYTSLIQVVFNGKWNPQTPPNGLHFMLRAVGKTRQLELCTNVFKGGDSKHTKKKLDYRLTKGLKFLVHVMEDEWGVTCCVGNELFTPIPWPKSAQWPLETNGKPWVVDFGVGFDNDDHSVQSKGDVWENLKVYNEDPELPELIPEPEPPLSTSPSPPPSNDEKLLTTLILRHPAVPAYEAAIAAYDDLIAIRKVLK